MAKVKTYLQLSKEERIKIEVLLKEGFSLSAIARLLQRAVSTISREVRRNGPVRYRAERAQQKTQSRHRQKRKHKVFDQAMKHFIAWHLSEQRLSPELISVKGKEWRADFISHEWIYSWIWQMKCSQARADRTHKDLYQYLRQACRRRKRGHKHCRRGNILYRVWIDERPKGIEKRNRAGHLECDIVLGKERKPGLLVAVDRSSRKAYLRKLKTKDADYVSERLRQICKAAGEVKTLTLDNDQSFAQHYKLSKCGIRTFFTHPYCSQEKGSVENKIGLIRMFFPKKTDFSKVSAYEVRKVEKLLNNRPLRMFNYQSPNEVHQKLQPLH